MSKSGSYYAPSGRVGVGAPAYVAIYAAVICYNPFIYFSSIATLLFGVLIGFIAVQAAQAGKSRSLPFNLLVTLILAASWYECSGCGVTVSPWRGFSRRSHVPWSCPCGPHASTAYPAGRVGDSSTFLRFPRKVSLSGSTASEDRSCWLTLR